MNRCIALALIGWVAVGVAQASPYWVAYEGDDFPENVGWERVNGDENGIGAGGQLANYMTGCLILTRRGINSSLTITSLNELLTPRRKSDSLPSGQYEF